MGLYLLSSRHINASPAYASIFDLENIFVAACGATLISPSARKIVRSLNESRSLKPAQKILSRTISKTLGLYKLDDDIGNFSSDEPNVLIVIGMNGSDLGMIDSIDKWRTKFDLVVAFIYDSWLINSYPAFTRDIDHLFVPVLDLVPALKAEFSIPVSYLPHGANVVDLGSPKLNRCIDIASYGRIPTNYHMRFFDLLNAYGTDSFYYRQVPEYNRPYSDEPYNSSRFDYQHRVLLNKVLTNSKISLAFDFTYTTKYAVELANHKKHPSYLYKSPVLSLRWFEGLAAGCAIVGKRPPTPEVDELLNWTDSTIELPDDIDAGVEVTLNLLNDKDRLESIHQRNFWETLRHHDYRWRIQAIFNCLKLPVPSILQNELDQIEDRYNNSSLPKQELKIV